MLEIIAIHNNSIGVRYMTEKETLKRCSMCKKLLSGNKLTFSFCGGNWFCIGCYKNNFSPTPMHPTPLFPQTR